MRSGQLSGNQALAPGQQPEQYTPDPIAVPVRNEVATCLTELERRHDFLQVALQLFRFGDPQFAVCAGENTNLQTVLAESRNPFLEEIRQEIVFGDRSPAAFA